MAVIVTAVLNFWYHIPIFNEVFYLFLLFYIIPSRSPAQHLKRCKFQLFIENLGVQNGCCNGFVPRLRNRNPPPS